MKLEGLAGPGLAGKKPCFPGGIAETQLLENMRDVDVLKCSGGWSETLRAGADLTRQVAVPHSTCKML